MKRNCHERTGTWSLFSILMLLLFLCGCDNGSSRGLTDQAKSRYFVSVAADELLNLKNSGQPYRSDDLWTKVEGIYSTLVHQKYRGKRNWFVEEMWISEPDSENQKIVVVVKVVTGSGVDWMITSGQGDLVERPKIVPAPEDSLFEGLMPVDALETGTLDRNPLGAKRRD